MNNISGDFFWVGSWESFVDQINIHQHNHIIVGRYGGSSNAGQYKNEDGCLIWFNEHEDWEFVMILDAHNTAESAELILDQFEREKDQIKHLLSFPITQQTFNLLEKKIVDIFQSEEFLSMCRNVKGETACLIAVRKDKYVWWFPWVTVFFIIFTQNWLHWASTS